MGAFITTYSFLKKIMNKEESFTSILNKNLTANKLSSSDVQIIRDSLKSTVNKYYFIKFEVNSILKELDLNIEKDDLNLLILALGMVQYIKSLNKHDVLNFIKVDYDELGTNLSLENIETVIDKVGEKPMQIPEKFNSILSKKVSVTYSYPEWVIKMMFKHFGVKDTYKSVASSRHSLPLCVNYNPMLITPNDLDKNMFRKTKFSDTAHAYLGTEKIIQIPLFKENKVFVEDETSQLLISVLNPNQGDNILFVDEANGVMPIDACLRCNDFCNIQVACRDSIVNNTVKNLIFRFHLSSIRPFETEAKLLITHVEPRSMDKVLVTPKSSSLGLIRRHPDILLSLSREDLDGYIENQRNSLEEAERFVKPNGTLVYAVYTMNLKEGQNIINEFLEKHTDYSVVSEKQIFPHSLPSDGVYYAKLQKNG